MWSWRPPLALSAQAFSTSAQPIDVKSRSTSLDLKHFQCTDTVSSFVNRVCYDQKNAYMVILLKSTWYHYCEIDNGTVQALIKAKSVGRYFNANVKGNFDCRTRRVPNATMYSVGLLLIAIPAMVTFLQVTGIAVKDSSHNASSPAI